MGFENASTVEYQRQKVKIDNLMAIVSMLVPASDGASSPGRKVNDIGLADDLKAPPAKTVSFFDAHQQNMQQAPGNKKYDANKMEDSLETNEKQKATNYYRNMQK